MGRQACKRTAPPLTALDAIPSGRGFRSVTNELSEAQAALVDKRAVHVCGGEPTGSDRRRERRDDNARAAGRMRDGDGAGPEKRQCSDGGGRDRRLRRRRSCPPIVMNFFSDWGLLWREHVWCRLLSAQAVAAHARFVCCLLQ